jgi:hypothetical protein
MSETIQRGERAAAIMADPLVSEALQTIRESTRDLFFDLAPESAKEREFLHLMDRARQQFERYFLLLIEGAKVEKSEILAETHAQARIDAIRRAASVR